VIRVDRGNREADYRVGNENALVVIYVQLMPTDQKKGISSDCVVLVQFDEEIRRFVLLMTHDPSRVSHLQFIG
jgi:hypothetical protein